ncbi:MAG: methylated-DNA--[protein]-cysteine S-methyltransferase [Burkholderiaceae bacterium]|nr:MAG: methylated-DNA--[protein]-cysteine S-methyltransferase [Burkholderiaceae bacterium]
MRDEQLIDYAAVMETPFGKLGIRSDDTVVHELVFLPARTTSKPASSKLAQRVVAQIERYLKDPSADFDLPLRSVGTDFQKRVWQQISAIPAGKTRSYGELAKSIRSAPRAVGQACGANFYPLVIPCHRVVSATGLGGFAHHDEGFHLRVKQWLLAHEGSAG